MLRAVGLSISLPCHEMCSRSRPERPYHHHHQTLTLGFWSLALRLQLLGEDLTEDEVKDMISEAISNFEGRVYYDGFVKTMIPPHTVKANARVRERAREQAGPLALARQRLAARRETRAEGGESTRANTARRKARHACGKW